MVPIYRHGLSRSLDRTFYDPTQDIDPPHRCASRILEVSLWCYPPRTRADLYFSSCLDSYELKIVRLQSQYLSRSSSGYRVIDSEMNSYRCCTRSSFLDMFSDLFTSPCYRVPRFFYLGNNIYPHLCTRTLSRALADFIFWLFSRSQTQDLC